MSVSTTSNDFPPMPDFLKRPKPARLSGKPQPAPVEPAPPEPVKYAKVDDMYMVGLYQNEGGHRRYLMVEETDRIVHLLYVPTLEHVEMTPRAFKDAMAKTAAGSDYEIAPIRADMVETLNVKAEQWDFYGFRYSRALVNKVLKRLGAAPLPSVPQVPEHLRPVKTDAKPKGEPKGPRTFEPPKNRVGKVSGIVEKIAALLLRPDGCTRQEILDLTGWSSVSVQQQARAAGIGLRIEGGRGNMRYYGVGEEPPKEQAPAPSPASPAPAPKGKGSPVAAPKGNKAKLPILTGALNQMLGSGKRKR